MIEIGGVVEVGEHSLTDGNSEVWGETEDLDIAEDRVLARSRRGIGGEKRRGER